MPATKILTSSKSTGRPKNLNVGIKKIQTNQEKSNKLMIDKKTYEDLMSYLVNADCNRIEQQ